MHLKSSIQIKTTMRYQFASIKRGHYKKKQKIESIGEDAEELEHLCTADGNAKWYSCCGKQYDCSSKN